MSFPTLGSDGSAKRTTVITIPIRMLWNVSISWKKKLALMSIFSLTIIVVVISIVRVAVGISKKSPADMGWLYMWSNVEVAVCTFFSFLHYPPYCSH